MSRVMPLLHPAAILCGTCLRDGPNFFEESMTYAVELIDTHRPTIVLVQVLCKHHVDCQVSITGVIDLHSAASSDIWETL